MEKLLSTKEVAQLLGVNEKMVYTLITEKSLPATKITGKWLFPAHLVEQWVESRTINFPSRAEALSPKAGMQTSRLQGYGHEVPRHLDIGLEILSGRADVGLSIRPVASLLNLDFIPLKWERYDLLIPKDCFFDKGVQLFLGMLHEPEFRALAEDLPGYDLELAGKMLYPREASPSA